MAFLSIEHYFQFQAWFHFLEHLHMEKLVLYQYSYFFIIRGMDDKKTIFNLGAFMIAIGGFVFLLGILAYLIT